MSISQIRQSIVAKLDLHGCQRDEAIRRLTNFLESSVRKHGTTNGKIWVEAVTGTGAHSSHIGGPILRTAVQQLLQKREMEFVLDPYTKGTFFINADSGFVLTNPQQTQASSKIMVLQDEKQFGSMKKKQLQQQQQALLNNQRHKQRRQQLQRQRKMQHDGYLGDDYDEYYTTTERMIHKVEQNSLKQQETRQHQEELQQIELAISLSRRQQQKQEYVEENDDDDFIKQALLLSCQEQEQQKEKEEDDFQNALKLSSKLHEKEQYYNQEYEEELKHIMRASQMDHDQTVLSQRELEQAFQQAVQLSLEDA